MEEARKSSLVVAIVLGREDDRLLIAGKAQSARGVVEGRRASESETEGIRRVWRKRIADIGKTRSSLTVAIGTSKAEDAKPLIERFEEQLARAKEDLRDEWVALEHDRQRAEDEASSIFEAVHSIVATATAPPVKTPKKPSRSRGVSEFEEFIRDAGGVTGGWSDSDHAEFVRARSSSLTEAVR
jgi:hypothetical protein